jgi:hypothetical protein
VVRGVNQAFPCWIFEIIEIVIKKGNFPNINQKIKMVKLSL